MLCEKHSRQKCFELWKMLISSIESCLMFMFGLVRAIK